MNHRGIILLCEDYESCKILAGLNGVLYKTFQIDHVMSCADMAVLQSGEFVLVGVAQYKISNS